ncbi:MAG TPA: hypothetical protein VN642_03045, partial [Dongiaceae bacterium]|nr:hypothetical protein [Dongiaceae bacterium]
LCRCISGYQWNEARTACVVDKAAQVAAADCSGTPNSRPYWDGNLGRVQCQFCNPGYRWVADTGLDCVDDNSDGNQQNPFGEALERITAQLLDANHQRETSQKDWGKPRSDLDNRGKGAVSDKDAALQQCVQCVNSLVGGACYVRIPTLAGWGLCLSCTPGGGVAEENRHIDRDKCPICQKAPWKLEDFKAYKHN